MKYKLFVVLLSLVFTSAVNAIEINIQVVGVEKQAMSDMIVFARPLSGVSHLTVNKQPLTVNQKDKKFAPYIAVIQKGQPLNFANQDDITHHIYSVSKGNRFDFKLKAGVNKSLQSLNFSGEVAMGCNIHDWMSGYVLVVDTPYYGKTNDEGSVGLVVDDKGKFEISVWHPQLELTDNRVVSTYNIDKQKVDVTITLPKKLSPIPTQVSQESFDFLDEY